MRETRTAMNRDRVYDRVMWVIFVPALALVVGGLLAAIWGAIGWLVYGKVLVSTLLVWLVLVIIAGAVLKPKRSR